MKFKFIFNSINFNTQLAHAYQNEHFMQKHNYFPQIFPNNTIFDH